MKDAAKLTSPGQRLHKRRKGSFYQRGGKWRICYCRRGRRSSESSDSTNREDAQKLLDRKRKNNCGRETGPAGVYDASTGKNYRVYS